MWYLQAKTLIFTIDFLQLSPFHDPKALKSMQQSVEYCISWSAVDLARESQNKASSLYNFHASSHPNFKFEEKSAPRTTYNAVVLVAVFWEEYFIRSRPGPSALEKAFLVTLQELLGTSFTSFLHSPPTSPSHISRTSWDQLHPFNTLQPEKVSRFH